MATAHTNLRNRIRIALGSRDDCVLWNNEQGMALYASGHEVEYGVGSGGCDLLGIAGLGRFIGLEVKVGKDSLKPKQKLFINLVNSYGGYACEVRSVEDAISAVEAAIRGEEAPAV